MAQKNMWTNLWLNCAHVAIKNLENSRKATRRKNWKAGK
jgi:hypothetical protein